MNMNPLYPKHYNHHETLYALQISPNLTDSLIDLSLLTSYWHPILTPTSQIFTTFAANCKS